MTEEHENVAEPEPREEATRPERFPELAELEEKIQRRLRSNQRFLERFMDEDFDDLDDDDICGSDDDDPEQMEEL
jgi:hypothetical protein